MLVNVAGGYTISGLEGFEDDVSSESLVTCILKASSVAAAGQRALLSAYTSVCGIQAA